MPVAGSEYQDTTEGRHGRMRMMVCAVAAGLIGYYFTSID